MWQNAEENKDCETAKTGQSKCKLYFPPPRIKLGLQLNYRTINVNNQPTKTSWREVLSPRIHGRSHIKTGKKCDSPTQMWWWRIWRDISVAKVTPEEKRLSVNDVSKNRKISLAKKNSPHAAEFRRKNALGIM